MEILSEEKIIVTRTTYVSDDTKERVFHPVVSVVTKVESDGEVIYERKMAEHLLRKQPERCSPVECFIDYIQNLAGEPPKCYCNNDLIRQELINVFKDIYDCDSNGTPTKERPRPEIEDTHTGW